jgi:prepilin-type N-terminal cleavage/methylation domain-containing protein
MMKMRRYRKTSGFTIVELLVVLIIIGLLTAIAAPAWQGFLTNQRLSAAQNAAFLAIREAQSNAKRTKEDWIVVFRRNPSGESQYAVLGLNGVNQATVAGSDALPWRNLGEGVTIVPNTDPNTPRTSFFKVAGQETYYLRFDKNGFAPSIGAAGRNIVITGFVAGRQVGDRRCVLINTMVGGLRQTCPSS